MFTAWYLLYKRKLTFYTKWFGVCLFIRNTLSVYVSIYQKAGRNLLAVFCFFIFHSTPLQQPPDFLSLSFLCGKKLDFFVLTIFPDIACIIFRYCFHLGKSQVEQGIRCFLESVALYKKSVIILF